MKTARIPTVVVINDHPAQLHLATEVLSKDGLRVLPFQDAEEALRAIGTQEPVDAIVTDLHMPGIDGWRLCRLLRSPEYPAFNRTPILVVSATYSGADAEQVTVDIGANAFLSSPYDTAALRDCVRDLLRGRRPRAEVHALVAHENEERAQEIRRAFDAHGYRTQTATSMADLRRCLDERISEAIVVSHQLPGLGRGDLLKQMGLHNGVAVVLVTTSDPDAEIALELVRRGVDGYVREPFVPEYLVDLCEKARRERALMRVETLLEERTQQLRESEARFRSLFVGIPEAVFVHDETGAILHVNDVSARKLGWTAADLERCNWSDYAVPEDRDKIGIAGERALLLGSHVFEVTCVSRLGGRVDLAVSSSRIDFEGRPSILSVARDITAKNERERQRADFMAMFSHDIRNPLGVVLGYAEMLRETEALDPEAEDTLRRLESNAQAAVALVSNYLDLSRIEANCLMIKSQPVQLNDVFNRVLQQYDADARRQKIAIELQLDDGVPTIRADALALERVVSNLLHNALKFTPEGGRVTLASEWDDGVLTASVSDTGPGIPADEVPTIFDRYQRGAGNSAKNGTGLGLFIAKALVEAHGGTIGVETAPGRGCCFRIVLSVAPDNIVAEPEAALA